MSAMEADLARVGTAHRRLDDALEGLSDELAHGPSRLARWSVGHVLTHLARNADSHVRRAHAALAGEVVDQYEGGVEGRNAAIEDGAARSADALRDDVRVSSRRLEATWASLPETAWSGVTRDTSGRERPLCELPEARLVEVEVHLVDTGLAGTFRSWPEDFVARALPKARGRVASSASATIVPSFDDPFEELAWLFGRLERNDLPPSPPWG